MNPSPTASFSFSPKQVSPKSPACLQSTFWPSLGPVWILRENPQRLFGTSDGLPDRPPGFTPNPNLFSLLRTPADTPTFLAPSGKNYVYPSDSLRSVSASSDLTQKSSAILSWGMAFGHAPRKCIFPPGGYFIKYPHILHIYQRWLRHPTGIYIKSKIFHKISKKREYLGPLPHLSTSQVGPRPPLRGPHPSHPPGISIR